MWLQLLYAGFEAGVWFGPLAPKVLGSDSKTRLHTPKAVPYHEQPHYCRFMIGHSLGRMESSCRAILINNMHTSAKHGF